MAKKPEQAIMYLSDSEQKRIWDAVKASFGAGFSISGLLYRLVQDRYFEVTEGRTKRQIGESTLAVATEGRDLTRQVLKILVDNHCKANGLQAASPVLVDEYTAAKAPGCDSVEDEY